MRLKSRRLLWAQFLPIIPGGVAFAVAFFAETPYAQSPYTPLVAWCVANWWLLLTLGCAISVVPVMLGAWVYLRCPLCNFRFARAAINLFAFASSEQLIKYCPHCGVSLSEKLRDS